MDEQELHDTNDPKEHARRLALYHATTVGKVWQPQPNGEVWLVDVIDGSSSSAARLTPPPRLAPFLS